MKLTKFEKFSGEAANNLGAVKTFYSSSTKVTDWLDNENPPTDEALNAEIDRLEVEYNAQAYARTRRPLYPSIQEQLDMQYWDAVNGTKKWQEAVAKVKTDNPKPS